MRCQNDLKKVSAVIDARLLDNDGKQVVAGEGGGDLTLDFTIVDNDLHLSGFLDGRPFYFVEDVMHVD